MQRWIGIDSRLELCVLCTILETLLNICLLLTQVWASGQNTGPNKLQADIHGSFQYVAQLSAHYCTARDNLGRELDKAFEDVLPYSQAKGVVNYKLKDLPVPTRLSAANQTAVEERVETGSYSIGS